MVTNQNRLTLIFYYFFKINLKVIPFILKHLVPSMSLYSSFRQLSYSVTFKQKKTAKTPSFATTTISDTNINSLL